MATAAASFSADPIRPPHALLALTELPRAILEYGLYHLSAERLAAAPRGDGRPVLVLPGFIAGDGSTAILRRYLASLDYDVHAWALGRNLGPKSIGREGEKLVARLLEVHETTGETVSLVGWSLGGIMARLLAQRAPQAVRQVITLGAPVGGSPRATNVWRLYQWLTGQLIDDAHTRGQLRECAAAPSVPTTAIYSRGDGIVAWQNCVAPNSARTDNIEVRGSHCGLCVNPDVLSVIAERLAAAEARH